MNKLLNKIIILLLLSSIGKAQLAVVADNSFNVGVGPDIMVFATRTQTNGNILLYGNFTNFNNKPYFNFARITSNGALDTTFNCGSCLYSAPTNSWGVCNSFALQADGKILIFGKFNSFNNYTCSNLVRLNTNGSVDTTFKTSYGFNEQIYTVAQQSNGKIIVGGFFTKYGNDSCGKICRLNTNGSIDTTFKSRKGFNVLANPSSSVLTLYVGNNDSVFAGGRFDMYASVYKNSVVKLNSNGMIDSTFNYYDPYNTGGHIVNKILPTPDNSLMIIQDNDLTCGGSTSLAKLNRKGARDTVSFTFHSSLFCGAILGFAINKNNGKMIYTTTNNAMPLPFLPFLQLQSNGQTDSLNFKVGSSFMQAPGVNGYARSLSFQTDSSIIAAGVFNMFRGYNSKCVVKLKTQSVTGISELSYNKEKIKVFPNPSNGKIIVETDASSAIITVFDITGRIMTEEKLDIHTELNFDWLSNGTYIYLIKSNGITVKTDRLIINK
ncbi:MAG: T9SS type A sorting domain-containing protein [Bacteroidetes bacterium]|nr:T9SS type A sorting domain-containing protein [Bacteroidota bacterium]